MSSSERGPESASGVSPSSEREGETALSADTQPAPPGDEKAKPLLIGEAPSKTGDRFAEFPLSGNPARVLCNIAEFPPDAEGGPGKWTWALYERFECHNLIRRYKDAEPWQPALAQERAEEILERQDVPERPVIVFLGRKVGTAFGLHDMFFEWRELEDGPVSIMLPHPSGRNRLLNDPGVRAWMGGNLRKAIRLAEERS